MIYKENKDRALFTNLNLGKRKLFNFFEYMFCVTFIKS